jgi:hypothetical protein
MRLLILASLLSLTTSICGAQSDFRKGFIITTKADTVHGLVNFRESAQAHRSCGFKRTNDGAVETYAPDDILGYGFINDKTFEVIDIAEPNQPASRFFLEVLVRGKATLYEMDSKFWIIKEGQPLQQLTNTASEVFVGGNRVIKYTNAHISTLNILLADCAAVRPEIQNVQLSQKTLTSLIDKYNKCNGGSSKIYKENKAWSKIQAGLIGGMIYSTLDGFDPAISSTMGASINIMSPRLTERIAFHLDLLYTAPEFYRYTETTSGSNTKRDYTTIELQQLKIPMSVRYIFPEKSFTPYFDVGLVSVINVRSSASRLIEIENGNVVETFQGDFVPFQKNQFGFWGGIGVVKNVGKSIAAFAEFRLDGMLAITGSEGYRLAGYHFVFGIRSK